MAQNYAAFREVADQLARELVRSEREGSVPPSQQDRLNKQVAAESARLRARIRANILRGMSSTIDQALKTSILAMDAAKITKGIQIGTSFIGPDGNVRRYNAIKQTLQQSTWLKVNRDAMRAALAWKPDGIAFSDRVWDITWETQKQMIRIVNSGIAEGKSAQKISRQLRQYLQQPERRYGKALKNYRPGRGIYRSPYKNAMRLARTEMARAWTEGTIRYAQRKTWIDGYIWRRGSVLDCSTGECPANADKFYPKGEEPELPPHPNCLCRLDLHIEGDPKP